MTMTLYVLACAIVAWLGRTHRFGFWGYFFASALLTPIIGALLVISSIPHKPGAVGP